MNKVLLVEGFTWKQLGLDVIIAEKGKEGVEAAIGVKPDLILLDSRMPQMDGWQAARILRGDPETKNTPILAATAMSDHPIFKNGLTPDATTISSSHLRSTNF